MDLFNQEIITNILPFDGITNYHGLILDKNQCDFYYQKLIKTIQFNNDELGMERQNFLIRILK